MDAQIVFDIDGVRELIFAYCLPEYPVITIKMIDDRRDRLFENSRLAVLVDNKPELKYEIKPPKRIFKTNIFSNWVFPNDFSKKQIKEFKWIFYKNKFLCSLGIETSEFYTNGRKTRRIANQLTKTNRWLVYAEKIQLKEQLIKNESKKAYESYLENQNHSDYEW